MTRFGYNANKDLSEKALVQISKLFKVIYLIFKCCWAFLALEQLLKILDKQSKKKFLWSLLMI